MISNPAGHKQTNIEYYRKKSPGRTDYWKMMAAPRRRVDVFMKFIQELRPRSIVDIGCGEGELLSEVELRFPSISLCGLDISREQIELNRSNYKKVLWYEADIENENSLPNDLRERYDVAIASEIIEHVGRSGLFLENARSLLKPGGHILISTQSGNIYSTEKNVGHVKHFTRLELSELLKATGFEVMNVWNEGFPFHDLSKKFANVAPELTMKKFNDEGYGGFQKSVCALLRLAFKLNSKRHGVQLFAVGKKV